MIDTDKSERNRLATDHTVQFDWMRDELGHSFVKTAGFEEKLVRLARDPNHPQSVLAFMTSYWGRFSRTFRPGFEEFPDYRLIPITLQALAKPVAGLTDKVSLISWIEQGRPDSPELLAKITEKSLATVAERVDPVSIALKHEKLLSFAEADFGETPMGAAVMELHNVYATNPTDYDYMQRIVADGAAAGVLIWQAYAQDLADRGFSPEMPQPGLPSGEIQTWQ